MASSSVTAPDTDNWHGVIVKDLEGNDVELASRWSDRQAVLAAELMRLNSRLQSLESAPRLVAVGNGSRAFAKKFKSAVFKDGEVYIDSESNAFKAASLPRLSLWQAINALRWAKEMGSKYQDSDMQGDGQQTGGIFVVGPGVKKALKYSFREADAEPTEFADLEKIYEACGGSGPLNFGEAEADEHSDVKAEEKMGEEMETGVMAEAKNDDKAEKEAGLCAGIEEPAAKTQEKEEEDGHETKMHTEE